MKMLYAINALKGKFTTNLKLQLKKDHSDEEYGQERTKEETED